MIKKFLEITIPKFILVSITSILCGWLMSSKDALFSKNLFISLISYGLIMGAFNTFNCYYDWTSDKISKPYRPIPSLRMKRKEVMNLFIVLTISSLLLSLFVSFIVFIFILSVIFLSFVYSYPRIKIKKYFPFNTIIVAFCYVIIPLLIGWSLEFSLYSIPIPIFLILSLISIGFVTVKDITDIYADRVFNVSTLPIKIGISKMSKIISYFLILSYFLFIIFALLKILRLEFILLVSLTPFVWSLFNRIKKKPNAELGEKYLIIAIMLGIITELFVVVIYRMVMF